jgi:UDP-hydrolysing UDP-N-acetyl-D-glucosamine 2-epimerase
VKRIAVATTSRSEYGILRPVLRRIEADEELELLLIVSGSHLGGAHRSIEEIERDGIAVSARVPLFEEGLDDPVGFAAAVGRGVEGFARVLAELAPDVVLFVGDRAELLAVAAAALPQRIPLAHVHGGEVSEGAFDELTRHALTKLSHLHFASTEEHARRIRQLGEEPWRVVVSGAPALDAFAAAGRVDDAELERLVGMPLDRPTLLVTYHAPTLENGDVREGARAVLDAVELSGLPAVLTYPNADPGGVAIAGLIDDYVSGREDARSVPNLGADAYAALLRRVAAMVGNSSSGLIEAPSFELPVVNVGSRQDGRLRAANVIDVGADAGAIVAAIRRAVSPEFRAGLAGLVNPYGDGLAAERIVETLKATEPGPRLLRKRFVDLHG